MTKRLAVLSDIHGNLPALEAVLADVKRQDVDGLIVAGDFTGGPQPQEALDLLSASDAWMIRGNGEDYYLACDRGEGPPGWREGQQFAAIRWSYERLRPEGLATIASMPEQRVIALDGTGPVRVVHGSPQSAREHLIPERDPVAVRVYREAGILEPGAQPSPLWLAVDGVGEAVLVCGHSHIPWQQEEAGLLVVNAGSAGASNNGDWRAQYALLEWRAGRWRAAHRYVAYDLDRTQAAYRDSGYLAEGGAFARACLLGIESGRNVPGRLVAHVNAVAAGVGLSNRLVVPDQVWYAAVASFDWERAVGSVR